MSVQLKYQEGKREFALKSITVKVIQASNYMELQTGTGVQKVIPGDLIVTLRSGQQFPISVANFDEIAE